jgi:CHASE2 domain-containing sensor protein
MAERRIRPDVGLLVAVAGIAAVIAVGAYAGHLLRSPERESIDGRFSIRGAEASPANLAIVAVGDNTFNDFNRYSLRHPGFQASWPFPRCDDARVLDRVAAGHPKVIGVDVQFTEATTPRCDNALIQAVSDARPVVLGTTEVDAKGQTDIFGGLPLGQLGATAGITLMPADYGGIIRRIPDAVNGLTTFSVAAAAIARGGPVPAPGTRVHWIDYLGGPGTVKTYEYSDVYFGRVRPNVFRNKVVVLGVTSPGLQDVHVTPVSGDPSNLMSGPEIEANAIETALRGFPLRATPAWLNVLLIVLLAVIPAAASVRLRPLWVLPLGLAVGVLYAVAVQLAFNHGLIVLLLAPLIALALSTLGSMVVLYETALRRTASF